MKEFLHGSTTVLLQRIEHLEKLLARVPHFSLAQQKCEEVRDYLRQLREATSGPIDRAGGAECGTASEHPFSEVQ